MTQPHFSPAIIDTMMEEIALGYTFSTVCSGEERPTLGHFLHLAGTDEYLIPLFVAALLEATWVIAGEIRTLEADTTPENAVANKARFEMLHFDIKWKSALAKKLSEKLNNKNKIDSFF